jgi:hypothetical protein
MSKKPSLERLSDPDQHLHLHVDLLVPPCCSTGCHLQPKISHPILEGKSLPEWMKLDLRNFAHRSRSPPPPLLRLVIQGTEWRLSLVSHRVNQSRPRPRPKLVNQERAEHQPRPPLLTHYPNRPRPNPLERKGHQQQPLDRTGESQHLPLVDPRRPERQRNPNSQKHQNDCQSQAEVALGNLSLQPN